MWEEGSDKEYWVYIMQLHQDGWNTVEIATAFPSSDWRYCLWQGKAVGYNRFKMVIVLIYFFTLLLLAVCLYIDAMAYRGDVIGCTVKFESEVDWAVPMVFTLNGRPISHIYIDYTPGGKVRYPYIGMGHHGTRVLAKVCTIDSVNYGQFI